MNKLFSLFSLFLISSFLFSLNVSADTYIFDLTSEMDRLFSEPYTSLKSYSDDYVANNSTYYYLIYYTTQDYNYHSIFFDQLLEFQGNRICVTSSSSVHDYRYYDGSIVDSGLTGSSACFTFISGSSLDYRFYLYSSYSPVYMSHPTWLPNNIYNVTYDNYSFTFSRSMSTTDPILSLYGIYLTQHAPPVDPTPLLTDFFTLILDKITLACEFFTSSYIYLSIFVIFILYFVILLFRRLHS